MLDYKAFITVLVIIFAFSLISKRLSKSALTPPMFFVLVGIIIGPTLLNLTSVGHNEILITVFAEVTLVMILFTDAIHICARCLLFNKILMRLLFIGLPLAIILGFLMARYFFAFPNYLYYLIIATLLTPTDVSLSQSLTTDENIPSNIRESIIAEGALNDGIISILLLFMIFLFNFASSVELYDDRNMVFYWTYFIFYSLS